MPIRAYLVLHRTQLIWCAAVALLVPLLVVLFTASSSGVDVGVFWNHFCGCAPGKGDAFALLYAPLFSALVVGGLLGLGSGPAGTQAQTALAPGLRRGIPYILTRPMRRSAALLTPVIIAVVAIAILPALGFATVCGWMHMVQAPALAYFPEVVRLVPDAASLPPSTPLHQLLLAAHVIPIYLGSIAMGLLAYVLFYTQRWLMLSANAWVRTAAGVQTAMLFITPTVLRSTSPVLASWLFLIPGKHSLAWHPTPLLLLVHYAVPVAFVLWSWRTLKASNF